MNKRFRCVIAGWLLLMLCACTGGTDEPHIRYYRLASGQSENYLANQACQRFCDMVRRETDGAIQILPSFDNELGTDASALEQCVYGGIDFVRTPISSAAAYAPQLAALQLPYEYTSDKHLFPGAGRRSRSAGNGLARGQGPYRFKLFLCRLPVLFHDRKGDHLTR